MDERPTLIVYSGIKRPDAPATGTRREEYDKACRNRHSERE